MDRMVGICRGLKASASGINITGVHGKLLTEKYLTGREIDCSPENLQDAYGWVWTL